MATNVYQAKDNGDLKLLAEIDEMLEDSEAVELLIENAPRMKNVESFVVISGDLDDGVVSTVSQKETVTVKWASSRNGDEEEEVAAPKRRGRAAASANDDDDEDDAPAPKPRRGRPPGSGRKPAAKSTTKGRGGSKPATRGRAKSSGNKPAARGRGGSKPATRKTTTKKSGGSPFKRNAASDE